MADERKRRRWPWLVLALPVLYVMSGLAFEAIWAFDLLSEDQLKPEWIMPIYRPLALLFDSVPWLGDLHQEYWRWIRWLRGD